MDIVKVFGDNVKRYRQTLRISQESFCRETRSSPNIYLRNRMPSQKYIT